MFRHFYVVFIKIVIGLAITLVLASCSNQDKNALEEQIKISLREVGNQLLLSNQDSTSLILPVKKLDRSSFRLQFQNPLSFNPDKLVDIVEVSLKRFEFPQYYRVEVLQCTDGEVACSYEMSDDEENTLIPCAGRELPMACYSIEFKFLGLDKNSANSIIFLLIGVTLIIGVIGLFIHLRYTRKKGSKKETNSIAIGNFQFYQEQNILIKEAVEISLSKKECELLALLISKSNQVITRKELTKKVWEDNGVIVGRSLDTFISKLRKKLSTDDSLAIENVHGIGYKLVVSL